MVEVDIFELGELSELDLPAIGYVNAGFPSPADDFLSDRIDLNRELITNPTSTFFARVSGVSMTGDMEEGDLLVVDKSLTPKNGDIALCFLDGGFTVKRIKKEASKVYLLPTNAKFPVVEMQDGQELIVWGVVTYVIKKAKEL